MVRGDPLTFFAEIAPDQPGFLPTFWKFAKKTGAQLCWHKVGGTSGNQAPRKLAASTFELCTLLVQQRTMFTIIVILLTVKNKLVTEKKKFHWVKIAEISCDLDWRCCEWPNSQT